MVGPPLAELKLARPFRTASDRSIWTVGAQGAGRIGGKAGGSSIQSPSRMLDDAYDEFCALEDRGELVDVERFCAEHPLIQSSLRRLIDAHLFLDQSPLLKARCEAEWPALGAQLADFKLLTQLGRGSFARVYLAEEALVGGRLVALKATPFATKEAHFLGRLAHPHIMPIYSICENEATGLTLICMPYRGAATAEDLRDAAFSPNARRKASSVADAARARCEFPPTEPEPAAKGPIPADFEEAIALLMTETLDALAHAHAHGIVHGDLKPSNLLLTPTGRALLIDFNLAAEGERPDEAIGGTLSYMAPERLILLAQKGAEPSAPTPASDIYSVGVLLHQLLTGKLPYAASSASLPLCKHAAGLLEQQRQAEVQGIGFPLVNEPGLRAIVQKALKREPQERFASAADMKAALEEWRSPRARVGRLVRRRFGLACAAALCWLGALALASWAIATAPNELELLLSTAQAQCSAGDSAAAARTLTEAIRLNRNDPDLLFARGRAYLHCGDLTLARTDFIDVGRLRKGDVKARACLAYTYCAASDNNNYGHAAELWREVIDKGLRTPVIFHNFGVCLSQLNRLDEARQMLDLAIQGDPGLACAYYARACMGVKRQKPESLWLAAADYERALALTENGVWHKNAGHNYLRLAETEPLLLDLAYRHFSEAVALGVDPHWIRSEIGVNPYRHDPAFDWALCAPVRPGARSPTPTPSFLDPLN